VCPRRELDDEQTNRIVTILNAVIDDTGGADVRARSLAKQGLSPVLIAVSKCGGPKQTAIKMGISRNGLTKLLNKSTKKWIADWVEKLAEISGVSMKTLLNGPDHPNVEKARAKKSPAARKINEK
jgi:DNA invertase Pin-like site-specific DNA recombinase